MCVHSIYLEPVEEPCEVAQSAHAWDQTSNVWISRFTTEICSFFWAAGTPFTHVEHLFEILGTPEKTWCFCWNKRVQSEMYHSPRDGRQCRASSHNIHAKEPCLSAKQPYISAKVSLFRGQGIQFHQAHTCVLSQHPCKRALYFQKSSVFPGKKTLHFRHKALYFLKRALYFCKRALNFRTRALYFIEHIRASYRNVLAKTPSIFAKSLVTYYVVK